MTVENAIVVVGKTRLEQLIERFNTKAQARFYIEHAGGDFQDYEAEHDTFKRALDQVIKVTSAHVKMKLVERKFLPNFLFSDRDVVVALGQDGLVANTAKYIKGLPLLGVNPDPSRYDGLLLPFTEKTYGAALLRVLENRFTSRQVTMAQASTHDGQQLLAFNDFFIGPATHTSARYRIRFNSRSENQSSSGIIVSTGAGSTGWLSSIMNMSNGIQAVFQQRKDNLSLRMNWDEDRLAFVVREPFLSKHSQISVSGGLITPQQTLQLESQMPFNGVIFSDGIESDFLQFNAGCQVEISIAQQKAMIVQ